MDTDGRESITLTRWRNPPNAERTIDGARSGAKTNDWVGGGCVNSPEVDVIQVASVSPPVPWWKRVRWWAWVGVALIWVAYVWAGLIPLYYLNRIQTPPFEQLQRTDGKVFFKHIRGKNGGDQIGLEMADGRKELFTCSVGFRVPPDCVLTVKVKEFTGKPGRLLWYRMQDNIGHYRRYVMQVEIGGVVESPYERRLRFLGYGLDQAKKQFGYMSFMFAFLTYAILYRGVKRTG